MDNGWFIPDEHQNTMQMETFMSMINTICHGGMINVHARIDGKEYRWQCDGLAHARRIDYPNKHSAENFTREVSSETPYQDSMLQRQTKP